MNILNFTGHDINLFKEEDCVINERNQLMVPDRTYRPTAVIKPQGCIRAKTKQALIGALKINPQFDCKVNKIIYGEPMGIPNDYDPNSIDTFYIVSVLAAKAMNQKYGKKLTNLLIVNNSVRNLDGNVIGCTGFAHVY